MSTIDSANPPQEYPDIVGARPTNPFAASFKPFIPASAHLAELTWPYLITGTILGIIFGASSLYLVLKVGLTVSASIPLAVLSIIIFRIASRVLVGGGLLLVPAGGLSNSRVDQDPLL
jgi:hypothetical protein